MLKELPESLDRTYEQILRGINKANREHAHRLLQCLTVAVRPLRIAELAEVLAVDFGTTSGGETSRLKADWRWEDQEDAILSACSSLIVIVDEDEDASQEEEMSPSEDVAQSEDSSQDEEMSESEDLSQSEGASQDEDVSRFVQHTHSHSSRAVQFSHFSVKEFLTSPRLSTSDADLSHFHILMEPAHTIMARACLGTLLQLNGISDKDDVEERFPLARYAAEHWVTHAQFKDVSSHIREGMEILFDPDKPYFSAWIRIYDMDVEASKTSTFGYFSIKKSAAAPLYYVALCGFHDLVEHLINECSQEVNAVGGVYVSPLVAALEMEHFKVAELLYQHGARVDVQGYNKCTPLYVASFKGHPEIVEWLLHRGADPNPRDRFDGRTALHEAARFGSLKITQTLLQHDADPNVQNRNGEISLHLALENRKTNVARSTVALNKVSM